MGWFIAIFVTLVVAGSILWIKPSPRDVRITELRRKAMSQGLRVRLLDEKLRASLFPWLEDYRGYALYENHQLGTVEGRSLKAFELNRSEAMHELDLRRLGADELKLIELEKALPDGCRGLTLYPDGVGILWDERGDESVLEDFVEQLQVIHRLFS